MKRIGILGGIHHQEAIDYSNTLTELIVAEVGEPRAMGCILSTTVSYAYLEAFVRREHWSGVGNYLAELAVELERSGADFLILASPVLHRVAARIEAAVNIPFIHIVDVTAQEIRRLSLTKVGVLGTQALMEAPFYKNRFLKHGIEIIVPNSQISQSISRIITNELAFDIFESESRYIYLDVIQELTKHGIQGLIYGCSEIKQLVKSCNDFKLVLFDSKLLHCQKAVQLALEKEALFPS
jgi:aspartate racemase